MKWANCSAAKSKRFSLTEVEVAIPLSGWADRQLRDLAAATGSDTIAALTGAGLMGERAKLGGFRVPGRVSAGGGCRFFDTRHGHVALNLSRADDRALLPALLGKDAVDGDDDAAISAMFLDGETKTLVEQGRTLGLAIAALDEVPCSCESRSLGDERNTSIAGLLISQEHRRTTSGLLVVDLSALWAGPLASRLLRLAGAEVVRVESPNRPDAMRDGDAAFFAVLNNGKTTRSLDLRDPAGRDALIALIRRADVVIEAARPRALLQLGIDADALVREVPSLVWATITGHGVAGEAANWIGFGDDCGVAGGLSAALRDATGKIGFVGDAIADPLTGILAARKIVAQRTTGQGARLLFSMSDIVAKALAAERAHDEAALTASLNNWAATEEQAFPPC